MSFLSSLRGQLVLAIAGAAAIIAGAGLLAILLHEQWGGDVAAKLEYAVIGQASGAELQAIIDAEHATVRNVLIGSTAGSIALIGGLGWYLLVRRTGRRLSVIRSALLADATAGARIAVDGRDEIAAMARAAERRIEESAARSAAEKAASDERAKLQAIIQNGTSAIVTIDADERIESANPVACRLYLQDAAALIGVPVTTLFAAHDPAGEEGRARWRKLKEAGRLIETELERHDGTRLPVEIAVITFRRADGAVSFYNLIARDLSQRRAMERQLRDAETALRRQAEAAAAEAYARLHELMAGTAQGVLMCDADDRVVLINDAFLDTYLAGAEGRARRARVHHGMSFDALVRLVADADSFVLPPGAELERQIETWRAIRARGDGTSVSQDLAGGRHVVVSNSRTHDGGLLTIVTDVTDTVRRANDVALIADNVPALIAYIDDHRRIGFINRTGERWHAKPAHEMIGRHIEEALPAELIDFIRPLADGALRGEPQRAERRVRYPDGVTRWIEIRYVPDVRPDGTVAGFFALSIDNTGAVQSAQDLAAIANNLPVLIARVDAQERYRFINRTGELWYERPANNIVGRRLSEVMKPEHYRAVQPYVVAALGGQAQHFEYGVTRKDGTLRYVEARFIPDIGPDGAIEGYYSLVVDVSQRHEAEEQLRHVQRLEVVGQLTGGIAHDFNNILGVVLGNLDLLALLTKTEPQQALLVRRAIEAAERGASLTHRLLAFGRRQTLLTKLTDLNDLIIEMSDLLARTIGGHITIKTRLQPGLWLALIDPVQLESAILNLAINARDAMGGEIRIETANVTLDQAALASAEALPGDYVMVAVRDNGGGMPPEVLARALEPFFTTKEVGKGTGLGLPMVYGFVKQSGGHVTLESALGKGTTIRLYLPRAKAASKSAAGPAVPPADRRSAVG